MPVHHRQGLINLEIRLVGKGHYIVYGDKSWIIKQLRNGLDMPFILPQWIPQFIFVAVDILGPILAVLPTIDPTPIVFGLNNEYPIDRNDHMIYLCTVSNLLNKKGR